MDDRTTLQLLLDPPARPDPCVYVNGLPWIPPVPVDRRLATDAVVDHFLDRLKAMEEVVRAARALAESCGDTYIGSEIIDYAKDYDGEALNGLETALAAYDAVREVVP